jgi:hypothetical protein
VVTWYVQRVLRSLLSRAAPRLSWNWRYGQLLRASSEDSNSTRSESVGFVEIPDKAAHDTFHRDHALALQKQRALERFLAWSGEPFTVPGYNALIGERVEYYVDYAYCFHEPDGSLHPNWRERMVCPVTNLTNRVRGALLAIRHLLRGRPPENVRVYATEQVTPFFSWLKKEHPRAVGSEFLGDAVALGGSAHGIRNEDLTRLTFADGSFEMVVTNDVLEHVPAYQRAYRELFRVLAPGGVLVFTVPFDLNRMDHLIRARLRPDGTVEHLLTPEYHGNPIDAAGGILCYQMFGWRMLDELREVGFAKAAALRYWSLLHGLLGPDQCVFFALKPR